MHTLYVRIIATMMIIMVVSSLIAFLVSNVYYHQYLKPVNDKKVTQIAENIVSVFENNSEAEISSYLLSMADLGYKFYVVDHNGNSNVYGKDFRVYNLDPEAVDQVLSGDTYHGIANFSWRPLVTGFYNDELKNTVGIPINFEGERLALFTRADTVQQFGEMRIFLAVLLVLILFFSFIFVLTSTQFIVKPIRNLTEATKKIAAGNYHIKLKESQRDEIGRLAIDFAKMSSSLAKTEERRQEFVSNVSHEIQSPLTSIQGFSQALREESISDEDRTRYLSIIEKESRRLSLLSRQLLTLSFLDSEIDNSEKVEYNLLEQLKEVVSTTEWLWREKEITIEIDIPSINIIGDPKMLHLVWMNLLTNAIRYSSPGGTIEIQAIERKTDVDLVFKDTGVGIAEVDISEIFDRFYKVDKARTRTETSTGLGLSIVKRIIELYGGTIMVESVLGEGSKFIATIPKD